MLGAALTLLLAALVHAAAGYPDRGQGGRVRVLSGGCNNAR